MLGKLGGEPGAEPAVVSNSPAREFLSIHSTQSWEQVLTFRPDRAARRLTVYPASPSLGTGLARSISRTGQPVAGESAWSASEQARLRTPDRSDHP
jgi:hypothetical protein